MEKGTRELIKDLRRLGLIRTIGVGVDGFSVSGLYGYQIEETADGVMGIERHVEE